MQHAWKHVERPGGSHTALDGKNMRSGGSQRALVTRASQIYRDQSVDSGIGVPEHDLESWGSARESA